MTKQDYIKLAAALRASKPAVQHDAQGNPMLIDSARIAQWLDTVDVMVKILQNDNAKFDRNRFVNACHGVGVPT